jgi:putative membrane protein
MSLAHRIDPRRWPHRVLLVVASALLAACAGAPETGTPAGTRSDFAREAAIANMTEIELGKLAVDKSGDPAIRAFAQRMVDEHSKAFAELKAVVGNSGVGTPTQLDGPHGARVQRLDRLSGAEFDVAYTEAMVVEHRQAIERFERERGAGDTALSAYAAKYLPALREHLREAAALQRGVATRGR